MKFFLRLYISVILFLSLGGLQAQEEPAPFWNEIQAFKKGDSAVFPPPGQILFVGSSSFNFWKDVQDYFPGYPILNRGFGGSSLTDVIRYAPDIIYPYKPKQVVIYCGENDLANADTIGAQTVLERFRILFSMIRNEFKNIPVVYVSIKPSPSRQKLVPKMIASNEAIQKFLSRKKNAVFIDVFHKMLNADGTPMEDIFTEDKLHMNKKGYAIWQKEIAPFLLK